MHPVPTSARAQPRQPADPDVQLFMAMGRDANCVPRDWVMVVHRLPALHQRIVQVVNGCGLTWPQPVASVSQAIVRLGFNTVRNLARTLV